MKPHERNLGHVGCALEGPMSTIASWPLWAGGGFASPPQSNLMFCQRPKETGLSDHRLKSWKPFLFSGWYIQAPCQNVSHSILRVLWASLVWSDAGSGEETQGTSAPTIPTFGSPPLLFYPCIQASVGASGLPSIPCGPGPLYASAHYLYPLYVLAFCSSVASSESAAYSLQTDLQSPSPLLTTWPTPALDSCTLTTACISMCPSLPAGSAASPYSSLWV